MGAKYIVLKVVTPLGRRVARLSVISHDADVPRSDSLVARQIDLCIDLPQHHAGTNRKIPPSSPPMSLSVGRRESITVRGERDCPEIGGIKPPSPIVGMAGRLD